MRSSSAMKYTLKVKPQLVRKNIVPVVQNVVISSKTKQIKLTDLRTVITPKSSAVAPATPAAPAVRQPSKSAVANNGRLIKRKSSGKLVVKHITAEPNPESTPKILGIRGIGKGKILVIVGNGPSINEVDLHLLKGHPRIEFLSINKPDKRVWPTQYWSFFDSSQFMRHQDLWNDYSGYIFNSSMIKRQKANSMQFRLISEWSKDLVKGLHIGRSSVYASMQIAAWMGFEHVYIFGCDMHPDGVNGVLHFYGQNPDVPPEIRKTRFANEANYYESAAKQLTDLERKKYTFCSEYNPWSFPDLYNRMSHIGSIGHILNHADNMP